jgi:Cyanate lyase C-terminal domain
MEEEFGEGNVSAIDFDLDLMRQPDPKGDRVKIVMVGKFLQNKKHQRSRSAAINRVMLLASNSTTELRWSTRPERFFRRVCRLGLSV